MLDVSSFFVVVVAAEGPNFQLDCISALSPSVHVLFPKALLRGVMMASALLVCAPSRREVRVSHPHYLQTGAATYWKVGQSCFL